MEKQYSVQFFTSFLESLQDVCRNYLNYNQFVEVSGYVCVEIDNMKKERYVLSELLQSSGSVVSESYCTKAFRTSTSSGTASKIASRHYTHTDRSDWNSHRSKDNFQRGQIRTSNSCQNMSEHLQMSSGLSHLGQGDGLGFGASIDSDYGHGFKQHQDMNSGMTFNPELHSRKVPVSLPVQTPLAHRSIPPDEVVFVDMTGCSNPTKQGSERTWPHSSIQESRRTADTNSQTFVSTSHINFSSGSPHEDSKHSPTQSQTYSNSETSVTLSQSFVESDIVKSETFDEDDVIDLDMLEDDLEDNQLVLSDPDYSGQNKITDISHDLSGSTDGISAQMATKKVNPGSIKVMKSAVKQFKLYHFDKYGKDIDMFSATPEELDGQLLEFFKGAKKRNGDDPTPGSLKTMQVCLDRYLKEGGYPYSINKDAKFKASRNYIKAKVEESNKTKVVQKPIPINDNDIEIMFQNNVLGAHSPDCLINTLWFLNTKFFAIRGPADHFSLKWGDIALRVNNQGQEYLERSFYSNVSLKLFAKPEDPSRCFVNFYKQYRSRRPNIVLDSSSPFYLKTLKTGEQWFGPETATWSCFTKIWRRMVSASGLHFKKKIF